MTAHEVINRNGKSRKISPKAKAANIAVIFLCAALALGSGFLIMRDLGQYAESAGTYDGLAEHVEIPEQISEPEEPGTGEEIGREDRRIFLW